ncbi:unnamed protein product [Diabrotica balteata]|uniref:MIR domain-containing protein n=1 Tax=Diabrotica balteata TaxID=107213 RepID=A0A9N9X8R2_DIABA|nr:unnamed protein product [Diabrotica balteata]
MSPQCQEVSCYIDYNISMPAQNLWKVEVINKEQNGDAWHTIQSLVRLIHVDSNTALKYTGRQLPDWGFHQHEVAADRVIIQDDTVWNVEEHRYTKSGDQKEREREMVTAEMIPTTPTRLSFWQKFFELHYKMMFANTENVQNHMYSSEPHEWPFLSRGIAYWISSTSNTSSAEVLWTCNKWSRKYMLLQNIMPGKIAGKCGPGQRRTSWLKNLRDWYGIDTSILFRVAVNKIKISVMATNVLKEHGSSSPFGKYSDMVFSYIWSIYILFSASNIPSSAQKTMLRLTSTHLDTVPENRRNLLYWLSLPLLTVLFRR